jgi:hypothetical protein
MKIIDLIMLSAVERTKNTDSSEDFGMAFLKECGMNKSGMTTWRKGVEEQWSKSTIRKHTKRFLP